MLFKTPKTDVHKSFISVNPTLESLSYMLRNPDTWPPGFEWNYDRSRSCAIGLAQRTWQLDHYDMTLTFNMPLNDANAIFVALCAPSVRFPWRTRENVTPAMVADAIDQYLAA